MEYTSEFDEINGICKICVTGEFNMQEDAPELRDLGLNHYRGNGCKRFLIDMTNAQINTTTLDTYYSVQLRENEDFRILRLKVANVVSKIDSDIHFIETAAQNRGYNLRVFDRIENAITWFKNDDTSERK